MADCCASVITGFCLDDNTPIGIVVQNGSQIGWINLLNSVFTPGAPPAGTISCGGGGGTVPEPLSVDDNGGSLTVDSVDLDIRNLSFVQDTVDVSGSSITIQEPLSIDDNGSSITVDAVDLDVRTLVFATDKVDVSGSIVTIQEPVSIDDNGSSLTVDSVDLDIRGLVFATDKVDVSGSIITVNEPVSIDDNGGSITVDGPLTDAQLRASTVPVQPDHPAGTLNNGAETAVSTLAVQVLAANGTRKKLIIQNTGDNAVRIGGSGVTATTGTRLKSDGILIFDMPHCPTNAIFAIRETADSTILAQEVT